MIDLLRKQKKVFSLSYHTILHCLVDFCCIYYMSMVVVPLSLGVGVGQYMFYVILYNFVAFAGQLPVGIFGDYIQRNHYMVASGLFLLLMAYVGTFFALPILTTVLLLGIGNACFHVGGGRDAMAYNENACWPVGVFVATGAFGVFGGRWIAGHGMNWLLPMTIVLIAALLIQIILCYISAEHKQNKQIFSLEYTQGRWSLLIAFCCFIVVVLRSFAGTVFKFSWSSGSLALLMTVGIVLGKALGGILADRFGIQRTVLVSLTCSTILFFGANTVPVMGLLAVFLFNMTMPITLSMLGMHFPHAKGTMFGALTFAIFLGLIPSYFCNIAQFSQTWMYVLLTAASLVLLYIPLFLANRDKQES